MPSMAQPKPLGCAGWPRPVLPPRVHRSGLLKVPKASGHLRASDVSETQTTTDVQPTAATEVPSQPAVTYRSLASRSSVASLSSLASLSSMASVSSMSSIDEYEEVNNFRFLPSQLKVFEDLAASMQNCSRGLSALAFGNVVMNALEAVEHTHHQLQHAGQSAVAAAEAGVEAVAGAAAQASVAATEVAAAAAAAAGHTSGSVAAAAMAGSSSVLFVQEWARAVSLTDVAFCANELIPALLITYAAAPFEKLARNPDEPQMALALQGVGRLSLTLQQLAWTSGSVAVVWLMTAATEYPAIVGVASWGCIALAAARGASLWWVISQHTTSGEEVARTLAALRGGRGARDLNPLDRAASWLALGVLLQAEGRLHADQNRLQHHLEHLASHLQRDGADWGPHGAHGAHGPHHGSGAAAIACTPLSSPAAASRSPHYSFDLEEERVLRSLVEAANAAGLAISLLVLATLSLGLAEAAGESSNGWVSSVILASQKAANAAALFASATAFDRALHDDDGADDTDHLIEGLGREHSGMTGLFNSMAVLSLALILAGSVALLIPSLEDSPLGVLVGDGVMHASADLLIEVLEAL